MPGGWPRSVLRPVRPEVGIRQPSLYEYFDSKNALYDAMFADGNRRLVERLDAVTFSSKPRDALKQWLAAFTTFAGEDPARYQLLFQRPIPGFAPSPESYALAEDVLSRAVTLMRAAGVTGQGDIDCIVAMTAGLTEAQLSNSPAILRPDGAEHRDTDVPSHQSGGPDERHSNPASCPGLR